MKRSIKECQEILEVAIGEVEYHIPSDVLEQTIEYLSELKQKRAELKRVKREHEKMRSDALWSKYPDGFY